MIIWRCIMINIKFTIFFTLAGFNSAFKEHMQRGSQVWIAMSTDNKFQLLVMNMEDMGQIRSMNEVWIEGMLVQQFLQHLRRTFALDHITSAYQDVFVTKPRRVIRITFLFGVWFLHIDFSVCDSFIMISKKKLSQAS